MIDVPCYIINLEQDSIKKETIQQECLKVGLTPIFTKAVYGADLLQSEIDRVYDKKAAIKYFNRELTKGEIGTVLSHLHIYNEIVENNLSYALILEDDVILSEDLKQILSSVTKLPRDWEVVLLGHHTGRSRKIDTLASVWHQQSINDNYKCIRFAESPFGAYGYLITKTGAKKLLKQFTIIDRPLDHWNDDIVNLYGVIPSMINVNDDSSTDSLLTRERNKVYIKRTKYEQFKDNVQLLLKKLYLFKYVFFIRDKIIQLKKLKTYIQDL